MHLSSFWKWLLRRRPPALEHLHFRMYTRKGCHLCEDAWILLRTEQERFGFRLDSEDVDGLPDLAALYGDRVPVVVVNGKERFWGKINVVLLRRFLEAEARGGDHCPAP